MVLDEENVVGARIPVIREIKIEKVEYSMLTLPFWVDKLVDGLEEIARLRIQLASQPGSRGDPRCGSPQDYAASQLVREGSDPPSGIEHQDDWHCLVGPGASVGGSFKTCQT